MNLASHADLLCGAYTLHYKTNFQGVPVSIENRKGSVRRGVDPGGKPWQTKMQAPYGRIPRTLGMDHEPIDVFLGPNKNADKAYIIQVMKPPDFKQKDEEKVFLGFGSVDDAARCFSQHYDDPKFLGSIKTLSMDDFKRRISKSDGASIAAYGTSEGAMKGWDTRGRGRKTESEGMVSPNEREGTTLDDAKTALKSAQHATFASKAQQVLSGVTRNGQVLHGIGSWSDGAEDTVVLHGKMSYDDIRYATAKMGLLGNQKGVMVFHEQSGGKDSLWTVSVGRGYTEQQISDTLDKIGVSFRTLVQTKEGYDVHVVDTGTQMEGKIVEVAKAYGTNYTQKTGRGEFIGGDTRAEGAAAYNSIIGDYERKRGIRSAQDRSDRAGHSMGFLYGPSSGQITPLERAIRATYGGPQANYSHMDTMVTNHPPSLRNPQKIPVDSPWEKDDRFGDVSRRKKAQKFREQLMRHHGSDSRDRSVGTTQIGGFPSVTIGGFG